MALPCSKDETIVEVEGTLVSQPYVDDDAGRDARPSASTRATARTVGSTSTPLSTRAATTRSSPTPRPPATSSPLAAITGGEVTVEGLDEASLQGDLDFIDVLEHMGCTVRREAGRTTVIGGPLRAVDVDMNAISDTVMTLAVVALFADGITRIRNVAHIRHKETDRIAALAAELRKLGADGRRAPRRPGHPPARGFGPEAGRRSPPTTTTGWPCRSPSPA